MTEFNPDGTIKRAGFISNYGNSWLYMYAFQNNVNFMSADGRTCTLNSPEVQESLSSWWMDTHCWVGLITRTNSKADSRAARTIPFATGKVAMLINGTGRSPDIPARLKRKVQNRAGTSAR
ncbi:MAG: hypothetical protein R2688_01200 [Fimbriimonadaceae bacterium]